MEQVPEEVERISRRIAKEEGIKLFKQFAGKFRKLSEEGNKVEQISESNIDACSCCGEFHSVAWYNVENEQDILLCDSCLQEIYCQKV